MENHVNESAAIPKWSALLIEAVTKPGLMLGVLISMKFQLGPKLRRASDHTFF